MEKIENYGLNELEFKNKLREEINYYRSISVERLIDEKTAVFYEISEKEQMTEKQQEDYIKEGIKDEIEYKKRLDSIKEELIEKYIELAWEKELLYKKEEEIIDKIWDIREQEDLVFDKKTRKETGFKDLNEVINNVEFMSENDFSLKKYIRENIINILPPTIAMTMVGTGIFTALDYLVLNIDSSIPVYALNIAVLSSIAGSVMMLVEWFTAKRKNPEAVRILKEKGLYDLLLEQIKIREEKYEKDDEIYEIISGKGIGR